MYHIQWEKKAIRQLKKFQTSERLLISEAVMALEKWPDCTNVKSLVNHKYGYRLRLGRFRIFFDVGLSLNIVMIEEVKKRDEHTY
jgi:mRNA-degrading endonuclease RelE of RelBE toxin-antitoxin system